MLTRLTNKIHNSLYIFSKPRKAPANYLPLYQSSIFKSEDFNDVFKEIQAVKRYKQLLPTLFTSQTGFYPYRYLYTALGFDPENEVLRITTLRAGGYHVQQFQIENIIPWSYRDMCAQSKLPEPLYPVFVDDEMIYYNTALKENLFAERDGQWNEETVKHPKLSLESRFNEKEWFDRQILN